MRFVIIGTGYIGPINTAALLTCPEAEIVAVANRTESKARAMCQQLGLQCPVYTDWRQMLAEVRPDAAVINLYNDLHKEAFLACAEAGIHVLVEKPVANTYADCLEMLEAARRGGIRAAVLHTQRYGSVLTTAKAYIRDHRQALGPLLGVNDNMNCHYFWDGRSPWHLDPVRSGGGIVMNYGVHQLDRVHWLLEQKTVDFRAHYLTRKPGVDTCSSYAMLGKTDGGAAYTVTCTGYAGPFVNEITLAFQNSVLRCVVMSSPTEEKGVYVDGRSIPLTVSDDNNAMYARELREAADYLTGKTDTPPISPEWGAEMVRLCELGFENG